MTDRPFRRLADAVRRLTTGSAGTAPDGERVSVAADYGDPAGYPLVKTKFDGFNSCMVPTERYERDAALLAGLDVETLRVDGGTGAPFSGWREPPIGGDAGDVDYDFSDADALVDRLRAAGVRPYWSYGYTPPPLRPADGDHRRPPADLDAWAAVVEAVAAHFRATDRPVAYHEIWNEPDLDLFFTGTRSEYLELYRRGVRAVRAADPDAAVGGPSVAGPDWDESFLSFVAEEGLPLDFFSFHHYGPDADARIETVQRRLDRNDRFDATELHLNEYNPTTADERTVDASSPPDRYPMAARLLADFKRLLAFPSLTKVHWAQIQDPGEGEERVGLIDVDGRAKAAYNAWRLYARLPVDSRRLDVDGPAGVDGMAATDGNRAGLVVWNRSGAHHHLEASLENVPFGTGEARVYRIDADHASHYDAPDTERLAPVERHEAVDLADWTWSGPLPADGVVAVELDAEDADGPPRDEEAAVAHVVGVERHYPDRGASSYAHFDRETWTARLGTTDDPADCERVGVTAERWPDGLTVESTLSGSDAGDFDGRPGVRLDYRADGEYARAVLFRPSTGAGGDPEGPPDDAAPWGTGRAPDDIVGVSEFGAFALDPARHAPEGWDGRAVLSFALRDAPPGTRWTATVRGEGSRDG